MEEKSGLDKLVDNLTEMGWVPNVSLENKGALFPSQNRFANCYTVTVLLSDSIYFLARSNVSTSFSGIYSIMDLPEEAEYKVYKKNWFDFLLFPKRQKVGVKFIDENITVVSSKWIPYKELNEENVNLFLEINKAAKPYILLIENNYLSSIIESLTDKKVIALETNDWIYKKEDLENLLKFGEKLIQNIKKSCI